MSRPDLYQSDEEREAAAKTLGGRCDALRDALRDACAPSSAVMDRLLSRLSARLGGKS